MINLLPPDLKQAYHYARRNYHLSRWIVVLLTVLAGAAIITAAGWVYLNQTSKQYQSQITASQKNLDAQSYKQVESQIKEMSNNLKLSVQVLSKQILFSELLIHLGTIMPKDTKLSALNISQTEGGIDITAVAKTYASATQIQVNMSDSSNKLFSKVDLVSITCDSSDTSDYPCKVSLRALFSNQNPFLFIHNTSRTT